MSDIHTHTHDDEQCHCNEDHKEQSANEDIALLKYMIEHNRHHGEDLHEFLHTLDSAGKKEATALVVEAMHFFDCGNEKLSAALRLLGGE